MNGTLLRSFLLACCALGASGVNASAVRALQPAATGTVEIATGTVEIATREVTRPDIAMAPDGNWLVFTALGHLFRVSADGGRADQLTFGPYFDSDPAVSPDGRSVVFASDRDGKSNGNLYRLDLESPDLGEPALERLTDEWWAARPVFSPDGSSIGYLSYEPRGLWAEYEFVAADGVLSQVRRIPATGGAPQSVTTQADLIRSVFFLPDGRLGWSALRPGEDGKTQTHLLARRGEDTLLTAAGVLDRVVAEPAGAGFFARRYDIPSSGFLVPQAEEIAYFPLTGEPRTATPKATMARSMMDGLESPQPRPSFAVAGEELFVGDRGKIWRVSRSSGERQALDLELRVAMEVFPRSAPPEFDPEVQNNTRGTILDPRLAPDGRSLVFVAAGSLWRKSLDSEPSGSGAARRLFPDGPFPDRWGFQWSVSISPDGRTIAFQESAGNLQQLRLADLETGSTRSLVTVDRTGRFEPAWSPDGRQLVYVRFASMVPRVFLMDVATGTSTQLTQATPRWMPRPHFSADGRSVYYTALGQLYRIPVEGGEAQTLTALSGHIADATASPDGAWLAFRRNEEIWVAPFTGRTAKAPVRDRDTRKLTDDGGFNFSFAPDSEALIYSTGAKVWRHPIHDRAGDVQTGDDQARSSIDAGLTLPRDRAQPMLIRGVRVLDFAAEDFTQPTSMLIEDGRIRWIGDEKGKNVPSAVQVLDASGRYAIPGLIDSHTHVATPIHFNPARDTSHMASNLASPTASPRCATWAAISPW